MGRLITFGAMPRARGARLVRPDWVEARSGWIERALAATRTRPTGGWYVLDASRAIARQPRAFAVAGEQLVVFRDRAGRVVAGPDQCPHMGARLSGGRTDGDEVVCPWHGMALGAAGCGTWKPRPTHDDGVLVWVRLDERGELSTASPILPARPRYFIDGVIRVEARCEPADVIANRLDPWHGTHLHAYAFGRLEVLAAGEDDVVVRVVKRLAGPIAVEVDARFHSPEPRTIAMTIISGEGRGSVVETHATPMEPGRTAVVEASLATSERVGFRVLRALAPVRRWLRPLLERTSRRLWVDDAAYAERRYELRTREGA
jgi:isorenieratene synthase